MGIILDPQSVRRLNSAINRIQRKVIIQKNELPMRCAADYVQLLHQNITTQKYKTTYPPYSPRYDKWKSRKFGRTYGFWHLTGRLLGALRPIKIAEGWFGGIDDPEVSDYAYVLEYGAKQPPPPARPLFRPTFEEFSEEHFPKQAARALESLKGAWY